jgi:hypothetical protein
MATRLRNTSNIFKRAVWATARQDSTGMSKSLSAMLWDREELR